MYGDRRDQFQQELFELVRKYDADFWRDEEYGHNEIFQGHTYLFWIDRNGLYLSDIWSAWRRNLAGKTDGSED